MKSHAEITETLKQHYEATLAQHGDSEKGHDWGEGTEAARFNVMFGLIEYDEYLRNYPVTSVDYKILDYGCGTGRFILWGDFNRYQYTGSDVSSQALESARYKLYHGSDGNFIHGDILSTPSKFDEYDYTIVNGIFTQKLDIDYYEFAQYWEATIKALWKITRRGIAVNFMSNVVDERRENLYHLAQDAVLYFAWKHLGTRNVVFRNDYGLFEYTAYIYK